MQFEGNFEVSASPSRVWVILTDPNKVAKAIPDVKSFQVKDQSSFYAEFTIKLGFIKGEIKMNFGYQDLRPYEQMRLVGRGTGAQSTVDLAIDLKMVASNGGSKISWTAVLVVGGLVAGLGARIMEGFAKQKIEQIVDALKNTISATP